MATHPSLTGYILTAVDRALSDRWNITFTDTDFHNADIDRPIRIRVALSDLPDDLLGLDELGEHFAGIDTNGDWTHDPVDGTDTCLIVELRVEADLEPHWTIYRPTDTSFGQTPPPADHEAEAEEEAQHPLKAKHRARFGAFSIDERVDIHLRWSRMSALGKLTARKNETQRTLTAAGRAARLAASEAIPVDLQSLADDVSKAISAIGSSDFTDLKPGLDLSLGSSQGNLALFDGPVPLMNFGLGSRRLAGAAVQQLAHDDSTILLVDEIEYGLEPHRLVHLLRHLRRKDAFAQVFVTTHSPTALQHLQPSDLMMVRSADGVTTVRCLGHPDSLKPVIKSTPEAFLARRVVLGEGKTEYGVLLSLIHLWDEENEKADCLPSAALSVVPAEGIGGPGTIQRARELLSVGYDVIVLLDSDDSETNTKVTGLTNAGGRAVRWPGNASIEQAVCNQLSVDGLSALLAAAVEAADEPDSAVAAISSHLKNHGGPDTPEALNVASWTQAGTSLEQARKVVGLAAKKSGWFKNVDKGKHLAQLVLTRPELQTGDVAQTVSRLRTYLYEQPLVPSEQGPATTTDADPVDDNTAGDEQLKE